MKTKTYNKLTSTFTAKPARKLLPKSLILRVLRNIFSDTPVKNVTKNKISNRARNTMWTDLLHHTQRKGVILSSEEQRKRTRVGSPARCIRQIEKGKKTGSHGPIRWSRKLQERWPFHGVGNGAHGGLKEIGILDSAPLLWVRALRDFGSVVGTRAAAFEFAFIQLRVE